MKFKLVPTVFAVSILLAGAASAATISITANQGNQLNGDPVAVARSDTNSVTDGDVNTFYSLGYGGTLTASIAPHQLASGSLVEVTFNNTPQHPESAEVYLGIDTSGILLGEIFNSASGIATTSANGATIIASPNTPSTGITSFFVNLGANAGSALTFLDTSGSLSGTVPTSDGFDIGELSLQPVPVPAGILLMGTALAGFGVMRRRKIKAG